MDLKRCLIGGEILLNFDLIGGELLLNLGFLGDMLSLGRLIGEAGLLLAPDGDLDGLNLGESEASCLPIILAGDIDTLPLLRLGGDTLSLLRLGGDLENLSLLRLDGELEISRLFLFA